MNVFLQSVEHTFEDQMKIKHRQLVTSHRELKHYLQQSGVSRLYTTDDCWLRSYNVCFCSHVCLYNLHLFYPEASNSFNILWLGFLQQKVSLCMCGGLHYSPCVIRTSTVIVDITCFILLDYKYNTTLRPANNRVLSTTGLVIR